MIKEIIKIKKQFIGILYIAAVICIGVIVFLAFRSDKSQPYIRAISTLKEIVEISDLSTYTAVYNGVATVYNSEETELIDFYVSYEAKVNAGFDFSKITFQYDEKANSITMTIPEITLTDITVDAGSMDYIFVNQKANTSTVSSIALKACEEDVRTESEEQEAILALAHENAGNVLQALIVPVIEHALPDCTLHIQ